MKAKKILLVEDSPTQAMQTRQELEQNGFAKVILAGNGVEALSKSRQEKPDLILSDVLMPVMDGFQLCHEIRKDLDLKDIPIILQTASYESKENQDFGLEIGADAYIPKGAPAKELLAIINKVTSQKKQEEKTRQFPQKTGMDFGEFEFLHQQRMLFNQIEQTASLKLANNSLSESEQRFRVVFEQAAVGVAQLETRTGRFIQINKKYCDFLGYTEEEMLKKTFQEVTYPDDVQMNMERNAQLISGEITEFSYDKRYIRKDGSIVWGNLTISPMWKSGEKPANYFHIAIVQDISARKHAEEEMHRLIDELRNLSEVEKKNRLFAEALAKNVISIRSSLNTDEILDSIIDNINDVVPADAISIMLIEGDQARIVRSRGYQERGLTDWVKQRKFDLEEIKTLKEIIRSKKYKITSNTDQSKEWTTIVEIAWIKSNILSPILDDQTVIGFVNVDSTTPDYFTEEHARQLMAFTDQVSTALKNARLYEATQQRMKRMQAMTQIDQAINSSLDLNISLEIVLSNAREQLSADAVDILLVNDATNSLVFSKAKGFKTDEIRKSNLELGSGLPGKAALERTLVAIPDLNSIEQSKFKNLLVEKEEFISYYCVPLITKGELIGVMEVYFRHAFQVDPEWLEFLEMLALQTAIAINNAELLISLQVRNIELLNAYETTLKGWVDALDMRDHETEGHTQRVAELSLKLAKLMGIKDKEIVHFQRGALLHDIGKVAVPDAILNKPGPLTEEEWVIMRKHPMYANQLLSKSAYLKPALDIPYSHHEKWDGRGYPQGLNGEAIPLAARIFAIVDVWDALISDRPYRKAWTKKKALEYIQEQSGKHFDPEVVSAFQAMIREDRK